MALNLAEMDKEYQETEAMPDGLGKGTYQCRIEKAVMKETRDGQYPMLNFELVVIAGEHTGEKCWFNITITGKKDNLRFVKRDLLKLGYSGPLGQLEQACDDFLDMCVEVTRAPQKDNPQQFNTFLNKKIDPSSVAPGYSDPGAADFAPPPEDANDF